MITVLLPRHLKAIAIFQPLPSRSISSCNNIFNLIWNRRNKAVLFDSLAPALLSRNTRAIGKNRHRRRSREFNFHGTVPGSVRQFYERIPRIRSRDGIVSRRRRPSCRKTDPIKRVSLLCALTFLEIAYGLSNSRQAGVLSAKLPSPRSRDRPIAFITPPWILHARFIAHFHIRPDASPYTRHSLSPFILPRPRKFPVFTGSDSYSIRQAR